MVRRRVKQPLPQPASTPGVRQPMLSSEGPLTDYSVAMLRAVVRAHEGGDFIRSGYLARHLERSADLAGALLQRLAGVEALPFCLEPANGTTNASGAKTRVEARWPTAFPRGVARSLLKSVWMLGFAGARLVAAYDPEADELVPSLEPWHPSLVRYQPWDGTWWALTAGGYVCIVDAGGAIAEGWAVAFAGSPRDAHFEGAVRCLAEPYLGAQYAARDARRHSERMGQGVLEAKVPGAQAETDECKRFLSAVSRIGATGVVATPQYLDNPQDPAAQASYGIELHFPPGEGMAGLLALDAREVQRIRLRLLGQDTTSVNKAGGGYATSKTGDGVRWDLTVGDAAILCSLACQLLDAWAAFEGRPRSLYPEPEYDTEEPEDEDAESKRRFQDGQALAQLVTALPALLQQAAEASLTVDVRALLERFDVPLVETTDDA